MKKYLLIFITIAIALTGCEDQFNPIDENLRSFEDIYNNPVFGEAYLMNAYSRIPSQIAIHLMMWQLIMLLQMIKHLVIW
jgi:hypothetical protein